MSISTNLFIGKDNVVFHSVIFPSSQLGTKDTWTKLNFLSTTEYLTYEGGKFSKSRGIGVFGDSARKTGVPADVWRYFLLSHPPETSDSEFTWEAFITANNSLLLNNFGNFVNRVTKFVNSRHYGGIIPDWATFYEDSFQSFKEDVNKLLAQYIEDLDSVRIRSALSTVLQISQQGNAFLQAHKLNNALAEQEPSKCAAVVGIAVHLVHLLASLAEPFLPDTAASINAQLLLDPLSIPDRWTADYIKSGHQIGKSEYLFRRIASEKADEWRKMFGSSEAAEVKDGPVPPGKQKGAILKRNTPSRREIRPKEC